MWVADNKCGASLCFYYCTWAENASILCYRSLETEKQPSERRQNRCRRWKCLTFAYDYKANFPVPLERVAGEDEKWENFQYDGTEVS